MSQGEFDIIKRYFQRTNHANDGVAVGIGDDCAILDIPEGYQLAVTTDSLVSGVHFFEDVDAYRLGYKSLAVNLSDLAAMGATAKWVSLAITLPEINEKWLAEFCKGFFALADKYNIQLIGGDTTKGPLSVTISAKGLVKTGKALKRNNAQEGDILCCSGVLGNGAAGLAVKNADLQLNQQQYFLDALELTEPQLSLAALLPDFASSCIDISDGLTQDLSHILTQSQCHAEIALEDLPLSDIMLDEIKSGNMTMPQAWEFALTGGDDYELLFTISEEKLALLKLQMNKTDLIVFEIGKITSSDIILENIQKNIQLTHKQQPIELTLSGWDHFK